MQWAIRHRDQNRTVRLSSGSNLVFIDPAITRRTAATGAAVAATQEPQSMSTTASSLARGFGIVLRQVCQLFNTITELYTSGLLHNMNITYQEANQLHVRDKNTVFTYDLRFMMFFFQLYLDVYGITLEAHLGLDTLSHGCH